MGYVCPMTTSRIKNKTIKIRTTQSEHDTMAKAAIKKGLPISSWMRMVALAAAVSGCGVAHADENARVIGMKREVLSAVLCIDLDAEQQDKVAIRKEYTDAQESGGGVVNLKDIKDLQEEFANARAEEKFVRKQMAELRVKPIDCDHVSRAFNCVNNACDQIACEPKLCDLRVFRENVGALVRESRLHTVDTPVSNKLYQW